MVGTVSPTVSKSKRLPLPPLMLPLMLLITVGVIDLDLVASGGYSSMSVSPIGLDS